ncbi:MAG: TetR/AcrR family transcriptional regulator [Bacteroidia bacterium]
MNTKERILHTALELYNESGPETVTVRHIAAAMGISHGNLCYHYPNTDAIVRALYDKLVGEMNNLVTGIQHSLPENDFQLLQFVVSQSRKGFETMYRYRFVMLNFHAIMRSDDYIRKNFRELTKQRTAEFRMMVDILTHTGITRSEHFAGEYDLLIELQLLAGDGWMARAEIVRKMNKTQAINYYTDVILAPWVAVMTEKGVKMYLELKKK